MWLRGTNRVTPTMGCPAKTWKKQRNTQTCSCLVDFIYIKTRLPGVFFHIDRPVHLRDSIRSLGRSGAPWTGPGPSSASQEAGPLRREGCIQWVGPGWFGAWVWFVWAGWWIGWSFVHCLIWLAGSPTGRLVDWSLGKPTVDVANSRRRPGKHVDATERPCCSP